MKKPRGRSSSKDRPPGEDADVWEYTAATIEPLKRGKPRVHIAGTAADDEPASRPALRQPKPAPHPVPRSKPSAPSPAADAAPARRPVPTLAEFDRKNARKIRGGRLDIEARVDLHGLRQSEAHAALRSFLFRCQSRGLRFVLIITGKGKPGGPSENPYTSYEGERGVLKRNVPRWLEEPDIRAIVVSFTTAAIQHGGEGAIYVHLRARDRS